MTTTETPQPQRLKMSGLRMATLIAGVLAIAGSQRLLDNGDFLWWGLAALAAGVTLILVGAVGLGRTIRSTSTEPAGYPTQLEGLQVLRFELIPVGTIILIVMGIAFLAGTLPARRAARQNPIDALRYE